MPQQQQQPPSSSSSAAGATASSLATRLRLFWDDLPLVTKSIFAACTSIYSAALLVGWDNLSSVCLSTDAVLTHIQLWRIITSVLFHAGLLHLVFNMMAFLPIGTALERTMGSFQFAWLIGLLTGGGALLYLTVARVCAILGFSSVAYQCAVGFSGVIFGLIPVDARQSGGTQRSIFGLFSVPSVAYPWVLLVLWQLLVPQSSFIGHLSGLAVGQLYVTRGLRWAVLSSERVQRVERGCVLRSVTSHPSYILASFDGGGGVGQGSILPTFFSFGANANASGGASGSSNGGGWLRGPWMPYPSALLQQPAATTTPQQQQQQQGPEPHRTDGDALSAGSPPIRALLGGGPTKLDPKAAAAAAAEARMQAASRNQGPGGGGSSGAGS